MNRGKKKGEGRNESTGEKEVVRKKKIEMQEIQKRKNSEEQMHLMFLDTNEKQGPKWSLTKDLEH